MPRKRIPSIPELNARRLAVAEKLLVELKKSEKNLSTYHMEPLAQNAVATVAESIRVVEACIKSSRDFQAKMKGQPS